MDPRREALRWLTLYRDLGLDQVGLSAPAPREQSRLAASAFDHERARLAALVRDATDAAQALDALQHEVIGACRRCRLCEGRTKIVFGVGSPQARLMFVGEGPGADEDLKGEPFVGRAGQLLDKIIAAMGLDRSRTYIANIVKCRPPENRAPLPDETAPCLPFLETQIALIRPKIIVALGRTALEGLTGVAQEGITKLRGRWFEHQGIPVIATFHPAYLLRNPAAKRPVWEDMQAVMQRLVAPD
jgi:DNA polymerase